MTLAPLAGYRVAITADRRAEEQEVLLSRLGAEVLHGPVIRTRPLIGDIEAATERLIAEPPDVLVIITALGIRGWFSAADGMGLGERLLSALTLGAHGRPRDLVVLARGSKAAGAALSLGLDVTWTAPQARSAEVVEHVRSAITAGVLPGSRVAVLLDGSADRSLVDQIAAVGGDVDVQAVAVYRWELPEDTGPAVRLMEAVIDGTADAVTFTSAHAVSNFASIAEQHGLIDQVRHCFERGSTTAVAVGPVTSARVRDLGLCTPVQPRTYRLGAMVQCLARSLQDHAVELRLAGLDVRVQGRLIQVEAGDPVVLSERERAVLGVLMRRSGAVVSKGELRREVWHNRADDHAVEVTVGRLRRRMGAASDGIETVMRRGYRLSSS